MKRILLVEDNRDHAELARIQLDKNGYEIEIAESGEAALERVSNNPLPDLILLDVGLPGISGLEVLQHLKEDLETRKIPVVMLTSSRDPDVVASAYNHHVNAFVRKPFDLARFVEMVQAVDRFWLGLAEQA